MLSEGAKSVANQLRQIADELNEEEQRRREQRRRSFTEATKFLLQIFYVYYLIFIVMIRFRALSSDL